MARRGGSVSGFGAAATGASQGPTVPVDLTNCDREPIHEIGAVQSVGFLVVLSADWMVARVSANAPEHLGGTVESLLGAAFRSVVGEAAAHTIRNRLSLLRGDDAVERAFAVRLQAGRPAYDLAVYMTGEGIVIEAEPSEMAGEVNAGSIVRSMLSRMQAQSGLVALAREAVRLVQAMTGFDRVMIYRFLDDESGEVIAERVRPGLEPFLGLRYPASDIPRQARALLVRNPVRVLVDVAQAPVPIVPALDPMGRPLDLSMSTLRAPSPIHVEYLRNMGVAATMTLSLVRDGRLWGLIACHHMSPRHVGYERRTTAELFTHMLSLLLDRSERQEVTRYEERTQQLHNRLLATVAGSGAMSETIAGMSDLLAELVPCDGLGVCVEGRVTLQGDTPTAAEFAELRRFLDTLAPSQVYATEELGRIYAPAREFPDRAAGMLAIPISRSPRDYLVFFRHEVARSVLWAGNPEKPVEVGPAGAQAVSAGPGAGELRLSPRKSFEAWREIKRGCSAPWTAAQRRAAESLRTTLLEVVMLLIGVSETERQAATQKQELLIAELNHRVRNILGLINGLISQSRTSSKDRDTFAAVLGERVHALARAHDQITAKSWGPGSLAALIATEAGAYPGVGQDRVRARGAPVLLQPQAFSTVALVVHELMTNAAKYGALSRPEGLVEIGWTIDALGRLVIDWSESDGPPVQRPTRRGFGSTIMERSIPHELGGEVRLDFAPAGFCGRFVLPSQHVVLGDNDAAPAAMAAARPPARLHGSVLLVEDNMLIAIDAEEMLLSLGADRVMVASGVEDALRLIEVEAPSFALLDLNLGIGTSLPVAARLLELGVPLVFATGYGDGGDQPEAYRETPTIAKPYTAAMVAQAAAAAMAVRR